MQLKNLALYRVSLSRIRTCCTCFGKLCICMYMHDCVCIWWLLYLFQVVVWSALFKYHLELGHYESAYKAMMANPDAVRSASCEESEVTQLSVDVRWWYLWCHTQVKAVAGGLEIIYCFISGLLYFTCCLTGIGPSTGIGRNMLCALGEHSWPRELWFIGLFMYIIYIH